MDLHRGMVSKEEIFLTKKSDILSILTRAMEQVQCSAGIGELLIQLEETIHLLREDKSALCSVDSFLDMQNKIFNTPSFEDEQADGDE